MPPPRPAPHRIAVLALPGVLPFDLSIATEVFGRAVHDDGGPAYEVVVCGEAPTFQTDHFDLAVRHRLHALRRADTVVVPGTVAPLAPVTPRVRRALVAARRRGARIASICSGAFALAQAGLLDGRRATTHWVAAPLLAQHHPAVVVDPKVLFVDAGRVLTSAGAAAGLDLCLHMVKQDHGVAVAARVARLSVVPLQRDGGQAQYIQPLDLPPERHLQGLLDWAHRHLHRPLTLDALAREACTSPRTLNRRFQAQLGCSPMQWLAEARVRRAQELLERTTLPVERIVAEVGLGSAAHFRAQFQRVAGTSPSAYRRDFGHRAGRAGG